MKAVKRTFRKAFGHALSSIPATSLATQSSTVTSHILSSPVYASASSLSIYLSTPVSEIQTDALVVRSLEDGKRVFIPYCPREDPTVMKMVRLKDLDTFKGLKLNRWSIREFTKDEVEQLEDADAEGSPFDLILVPGLAFDRTGQRIGHGRGYYDRFIASTLDYPERYDRPPPKTLALALSEQVLPEGESVPTEEWDLKPDYIVTPEGFLKSTD
ncbi:hypothetical protein MNV49_007019 [Pseudohyphozyma bogoriensis]|nr:hypothetical protein MNV49_007019 [Pseudohyphozyma bogoriensis]